MLNKFVINIFSVIIFPIIDIKNINAPFINNL